MQYEIGDKIKYLNRDGKWLNGVIHGSRTYEESSGIVKRVSYLVDTGNSVHEDTLLQNKAHVKMTARAHELIHENMPIDMDHEHPDHRKTLQEVTAKAFAQAQKEIKPSDEVVEVKVRQPEQIELPEDMIKKR